MANSSGVSPVTDPTTDSSSERNKQRRRRQEYIRQRVIEDSFVRIPELADEFQVSVMTIHRDLEALESQGWLRRVRGGATARPSALYHGDVRHRMSTATEEKAAVARHGLALVKPGQAIVLDDSTTALHLASMLPARGPLTVITNFLSVVKVLAGEPGIDLVCLGGEYYPAYDSFFGRQTVQNMEGLRGDILFMSTTAITSGACYHLSQETIQVKRALMAGVMRRVLLVDHSKFTRNAVHQLGRLDEFDKVIVDDGTPAATVTSLRASGIDVEVAGVDAGERQPEGTEPGGTT